MYDYETTGGHYVLPEESIRQLVMAVILEGVLDYRNALYENIYISKGEYRIGKAAIITELETFFNDVGFDSYRTLPPKILEFKKQVDKLSFAAIEKEEQHFKCPICGGKVTVKLGKSKMYSSGLHDRAKRATCEGCLFRVFA